MPRKSAQSMLDFALAFIVIVALSVGIVRIWAWFNANYAKAQVDYQNERKTAGQIEHPGQKSAFNPLKLDENWAFRSTTTENISGTNTEQSPENAEEECRQECPECGSGESFNSNCPCYTKCLCNYRVNPIADGYKEQADQSDNMANQLDDVADGLRDSADGCCHWWQICWWKGMGKTCSELKKAARKLEKERDQLHKRADDERKNATDLKDCCSNHDSRPEQDACIDSILNNLCPNLVDGAVTTWQNYQNDLRGYKQEVLDEINGLDTMVNDCEEESKEYCRGQCTFTAPDGSPYLNQACYNTCYEGTYNTRNNCCVNKNEAERKCYTIAWPAPCDFVESSPSCPTCPSSDSCCFSCGAKERGRKLQCEVDHYYNVLDAKIQHYIDTVGNCCNVCSPGDSPSACFNKQSACINNLDEEYNTTEEKANADVEKCIVQNE